MPSDKGRYKEFQQEMTTLTRGLSADEQLAVVRAKLLDYLAKNDVKVEDLPRVETIARNLLTDELAPFVDRVLRRYADVLRAVNEVYVDLGVDITRDFGKIYAIEQANARQFGEYEDSVVEEIKRNVRESIVTKERVTELETRLKTLQGKAAFYARTIAQTQMRVIARVAKGEKARIAEVVFFEYVGTVRQTTRPYCLKLIGKTFHIDTIRAMRNGNKEPVFDNCGGWNCIHDWEPDPFATEETPIDLAEVT